jgi:hypothetical protein
VWLTVVGSTAGGVGTLLLLLALDQLCRRSICCASMSMITGTVVSAGTNCEDIASAGRNYVTITCMSSVLV